MSELLSVLPGMKQGGTLTVNPQPSGRAKEVESSGCYYRPRHVGQALWHAINVLERLGRIQEAGKDTVCECKQAAFGMRGR